ncbi:MAG: cysteine peptidase family C39 domain-containing protein [Verrucomicrobiota bacterium]
MTVYLIIFAVVVLSASTAGWWIGGRLPGRADKLSFKSASLLIGLGVGWFVAAWLARPYADTDRPGATLAGWFAFSGKWWLLLAGAMFAHGLGCGLKQIPRPWPRRALYFGALLVLLGLVGLRTMPVYFLLGDGQRDAHGYLRQSKDYEFTCAAVALLNYLEQYRGDRGLTERGVSKNCGVTVEGTTIAALVRAARTYGLTNATARVLPWPELERRGRPAIVSISTLPQVHHATLFIRMDAQTVYFIDPAYGPWTVTRERFREIWYGKTVLLE